MPRRLGVWTVRGLALLFDIAACEGLGPSKIARLAARLRRLEATRGPLSEQEKLVAIADESVRRLARHRDERRALRMVIATGSGPLVAGGGTSAATMPTSTPRGNREVRRRGSVPIIDCYRLR